MILYFDTETTGLRPGNILQLSYILDYGDNVKGKNFYFYAENIEESATLIHGYTPEITYILSNGKVFKDYCEEIYNDFINAKLIVGHNVNFDIAFLIKEFKDLGLQFRYNQSFDTMRYFTTVLKIMRSSTKMYKYPKLSELVDFYSISDEEVLENISKIFGDYEGAFHEARFDTTAMYLAVQKSLSNLTKLKAHLEKYL